MRDHRHILIECYLGQLAPPSLQKFWRKRDRRRWRRYLSAIVLPMAVGGLLVLLDDLVLELIGEPHLWIAIIARAILFVGVYVLIRFVWRVLPRQHRHETRRARQWRVRGFSPAPPEAPPSEEDQRCVMSELKSRRELWQQRLRSSDRFRLLCTMLMLDPAARSLYCAWVLVVAIYLFSIPNEPRLLACFMVLVPLAWFVRAAWSSASVRRRLLRAWEERRCPACDYQLGHRDDTAQPHRCPECAFAWPLVPPPADIAANPPQPSALRSSEGWDEATRDQRSAGSPTGHVAP